VSLAIGAINFYGILVRLQPMLIGDEQEDEDVARFRRG
jgi:hypothetical protein